MNFKEYLVGKKIDPEAFSEGDPVRFKEFARIFAQVHPYSFTMQKLHLINMIRRAYPLPQEKWLKEAPKPLPEIKAKPKIVRPVTGASSGEPAKPAAPKFRPKPIIKKK